MIKIIFIPFFLAFFASLSYAEVSGQEAIDFVSLKNNFLFDGETPEILPNAQIEYARQKYWVVSIVSGNSLNALIPVTAGTTAEIARTASEKRELTRAAFVLRSYTLLKDSLAKQDQWVFSTVNSRFLQQLAGELNDERFDLATARSELKQYPEIQGGMDLVQEKLDSLKTSIEVASKKTSVIVELESTYFNQPDINSLGNLKQEFDDATKSFGNMRGLLNGYLSELDKVKQAVAQTTLSIDTKRSLANLLAAPLRLQRLPSMIASAALFEEKLQEIFDSALARMYTLLANLDTRIERNTAFQLLFGSNQELIGKTKGEYSTLKGIVEGIFSPQLESLWKEQSELAKLREDWKKAQAYYNSGDYSLAAQFAKSSANSAIRVYRAGFREQQPEQGSNTALLINGIIFLVLLLIILYAFRNRKKLLSLVSEPLGEKEYE